MPTRRRRAEGGLQELRRAAHERPRRTPLGRPPATAHRRRPAVGRHQGDHRAAEAPADHPRPRRPPPPAPLPRRVGSGQETSKSSRSDACASVSRDPIPVGVRGRRPARRSSRHRQDPRVVGDHVPGPAPQDGVGRRVAIGRVRQEPREGTPRRRRPPRTWPAAGRTRRGPGVRCPGVDDEQALPAAAMSNGTCPVSRDPQSSSSAWPAGTAGRRTGPSCRWHADVLVLGPAGDRASSARGRSAQQARSGERVAHSSAADEDSPLRRQVGVDGDAGAWTPMACRLQRPGDAGRVGGPAGNLAGRRPRRELPRPGHLPEARQPPRVRPARRRGRTPWPSANGARSRRCSRCARRSGWPGPARATAVRLPPNATRSSAALTRPCAPRGALPGVGDYGRAGLFRLPAEVGLGLRGRGDQQAGSPARRGRLGRMSAPVTSGTRRSPRGPRSRPVAEVVDRCWPGRAAPSASRCASARSVTWM